MTFPTTPRTLLGRLKPGADNAAWQTSWEEFFDIYHKAILDCVLAAFHKRGWYNVQEEDAGDVVMRVFQSFHNAQENFELNDAKGRLRQFLTVLCQRRVVDFIRSHSRQAHSHVPLEEFDAPVPSAHPWETEEEEAFKQAAIGVLLSTLRERISPRNYMILELVKFKGEKPEAVAAQFGVQRGVVDNTIYKAMKLLNELLVTSGLEKQL